MYPRPDMQPVKTWAQLSLDVPCADAMDWQSARSLSCRAWLCRFCAETVSARGGGGGAGSCGYATQPMIDPQASTATMSAEARCNCLMNVIPYWLVC